MISIDYDWIRLGIVLLCFASFNVEGRIDYNNAGGNSIFNQNIVKDANVPASTFLLDWDQLKSASRNDYNKLQKLQTATRDELFRMQRHTYMLSPITYNHYNGKIPTKVNFQHQFSLFNPFTPGSKEVKPKSIEMIPNAIASVPFVTTPAPLPSAPFVTTPAPLLTTSSTKAPQPEAKSEKLQFRKKIKKQSKIKSLEKLPRKNDPLKNIRRFLKAKSKPEAKPASVFRSPLKQEKPTPIKQEKPTPIRSSAIDESNDNHLSRFKVYQAVPDNDF